MPTRLIFCVDRSDARELVSWLSEEPKVQYGDYKVTMDPKTAERHVSQGKQCLVLGLLPEGWEKTIEFAQRALGKNPSLELYYYSNDTTTTLPTVFDERVKKSRLDVQLLARVFMARLSF